MGVLIPFLFPNKGVPLSTGIRVGAGGGWWQESEGRTDACNRGVARASV